MKAETAKRWRARHPGTWKAWYASNKDHRIAWQKRWVSENPETVKIMYREKQRRRRENDPGYVLLSALRSRILGALKNNTKGAKTRELLGMEVPEYRIYLQGQFRPGMTWDNYGEIWEIDHIRPCASFDLAQVEQQRECFNWSNTQPLFVEENLQKGERL